jgi:uncharacterized protein (UPF0264 family)
MTRFLASVRDSCEAEIVLAAGADIVDLKEPAQGALGAVAPKTIATCVARIAGRAPVSATVGDLPLQPDIVCAAVAATDALRVDDVKLGVMTPGGDPDACFAALSRLDRRAGLILVFFADAMPSFDPAYAAHRVGARGVMLDTAGKKATEALPDLMPQDEIARFVNSGREAGLKVGLAGSLRANHVKALLALRPDILGFRGALCREGFRDCPLDSAACAEIRALIPTANLEKDVRLPELHTAAVC